MKKLITRVDAERGIFQVTVADKDRWYFREGIDAENGLPTHLYKPSVTWITSTGYPKGIGLMKHIASKGWEESEAIKIAAGERGSKVHQAVGDLILGKTIGMQSEYRNPTTEQLEPLSLDEYECLMGFRAWWAAARPKVMLHEYVIWDEEHDFAGTLDLVAHLQDPPGLFLIDLKTSADVYPEHTCQVSAYREALMHDIPTALSGKFIPEAMPFMQLAILQVGGRVKNQRGWKLTPVPDRFDLFLAAKQIWAKETEGVQPFRAEYPLELSLPSGSDPVASAPISKARRKVST